MAKVNLHIASLVGPGETPAERTTLTVAPAYAFVDGTAINWPVPVTVNLTDGEGLISGMETEYLGEPLVWAFRLSFENGRGGVIGSYSATKTFPEDATGTVEYADMTDVDAIAIPGYGPTWAEQAKADAEAAEVSRIAAELAKTQAQAFGGTNNTQVAGFVASTGATKTALSTLIGDQLALPGSPVREIADATYMTPTGTDTKITNALAAFDPSIFIFGGSNANTARTAGPVKVWIMDVMPNNRLPGDIVFLSGIQAAEPPVSWFAKWDATTLAQADLTPVTSFPDTSGNGRTLTQATTSRQPTFHIAGGGVPAFLRFDGGDNLASAAFGAAVTQPYTICMTVRMTTVTTSASTTKRIIDGLDATNFVNFQQRGDGTNAKWQVSAGTTVSGPGTAVAGGWAVVTIVVNGSSSRIRINGVELTGNVGAATLGGITWGSKFDSTVFADFDSTGMRIAAGLLTSGNLAAVEKYFADQVGVTLP